MLQDAIVKPLRGGSITKNGLYNTAFLFKVFKQKKHIIGMKKSFYVGIIVLAVILFAISYFISPAISKPASNVFVSLTDPANVPSGTTSLNITYNSLRVHVIKSNSSSSWINLSASGSLNLLTLSNVSQVLGSFAAPNGTSINILKFNISSSSIELNGTVYPVTVPSNQIIINIPPSQAKVNGTVNLLTDFSPTVIPILTANSTIFILVPSVRAVVIPGFHKVSIGAKEDVSISQRAAIETARPNITASGASLSVVNGTTNFSITVTDNSNESVVLQHILVYGPENVSVSISAVKFINETMHNIIEGGVPRGIQNTNSSQNITSPINNSNTTMKAGSTGFAPFAATSSACNSTGFYVEFDVGGTPGGVPVTISSVKVTSSSGFNVVPSMNASGTYSTGSFFVVKGIVSNACSSGAYYNASLTIGYSYQNGALGTIRANATGTVYGTATKSISPSDLSAGISGAQNNNLPGETEVEITDRQEAEVHDMQAINFFISNNGKLVLPFSTALGTGISATAVNPSCAAIPSNRTVFNNSEADLTDIVKNCFAPLGYTISPFSSVTFTFTGRISLGFSKVLISPIVGDTYKIVVQGEAGARASLNSTAT